MRELRLPTQAEYDSWRAQITTKRVLKYLRDLEEEVVDLLVSGGYKNYSEVEKARGIIEGLSAIYHIGFAHEKEGD